MKKYNVLGTKVSAVNRKKSVEYFLKNIELSKNHYICCANVHTVVYGYENREYSYLLNNAFLTLPDGGPIAKEGNRKIDKNISKVSGVDFIEDVLENTKNKDINHFFYGNSKENLDVFISTIRQKYDGINICGYYPSVFRDLSTKEKRALKEKVKNSKTDIVWVALGAPKQEKFCAELCNETNACWIAVGGAFNVIADIVPRAPLWMQNHSLEWLYRLAKEPRRLFKRYLITNSKYIYYKYIKKYN